jgi:hypothetical protein
MGIPLEEYAEASFEIVTILALPMMTVAASETMLRRDMTTFPLSQTGAAAQSFGKNAFPLAKNVRQHRRDR